MMMKPLPGASFKMIQAEIGFGALKVLFHLPTRSAQLQTASGARGAVKGGQVVMVRLGISGGPVHHQPDPFQLPFGLLQTLLQENLAPSQSSRLGLATGRLPGASLPCPG